MMPNILNRNYQMLPAHPQLVGWYAADNLLGLGATAPADSTAISSWIDLSGRRNHLTQTTGANQPLFRTGIQNGLPGVQYVDATDVVFNTAVNGFSTAAMYCITASIVADTTNRKILYVIRSSVDTSVVQLYYRETALDFVANAPLTSSTNTQVTSGVYAAAPGIVEQFWQVTTGQSVFLNGVSQGTSAMATAYSIVPNVGLYLGNNNGANTSLQGYMLEALFYSTFLDAGQRTLVKRYLASKWNIAVV